jgi:alpha-tubulin suppressor-like RCC1 family protein
VPEPIPVMEDSVFVSVDVGGDANGGHSCGVTEAGAIYCWGLGERGELGDGLNTSSSVPVRVASDETFAVVAAGYRISCGVTADGDAYCWGLNHRGQLGIDVASSPDLCEAIETPCSKTPVPVSGGLRFQTVGADATLACGLTLDGYVYCWGRGVSSPNLVSAGIRFQLLAVGISHACGLDVGGVVHCWGSNDHGQLGDGTTTDRWGPGPVWGQP